jgi:predicted phosphodiesterase
MRIAVLADVHGNPTALEAVLTDIQAQGGVDEYWVLGDLAALGHDPAAALERLSRLEKARFVRGNTDRYLLTGERPGPQEDQVRAKIALLPRYVEMAASFAWTQGAVTAGDWLVWLAGLPLEERVTLPDGTRCLLVHAAPGKDEGPGIHPAMTDVQIANLTRDCQAEIVLVGHTHTPMDRSVNGVRVLNPGSLSNPYPPDLRAAYLLMEAEASGLKVEQRRVEYDRQAVIDALERLRHPGAGHIIRSLRGENKPYWLA